MTAGALTMPRRQAAVAPPQLPPVVSNARLAMIGVVVAETMLFVGFIGMFLVFRLSAPAWPPPNLPRLPLVVTGINSIVLFASMIPMTLALRAVRRDDTEGVRRNVRLTAILGSLFLVVQGFEWMRLVGHGLTLGSSIYGGTFYVLIGCHAVHVLTAVLWLVVVALLATRGRFTADRHDGLEMCGIYWYFVSGLWAVLFPLVYLY
jgi:cytochrome c oxidase subunit III